MLEWKKKPVLESLKDFLQNVQNIFSIFFSFSVENENKKSNPPLLPPLFPPFWGGSSAASPLEIWDVMPPYLKTLYEQKTEIYIYLIYIYIYIYIYLYIPEIPEDTLWAKNRNLIIFTIFAQTTPLNEVIFWSSQSIIFNLHILKRPLHGATWGRIMWGLTDELCTLWSQSVYMAGVPACITDKSLTSCWPEIRMYWRKRPLLCINIYIYIMSTLFY